MNINTIFNNYLANGYSNLNAISKTCQDIILAQISNSSLNKNVTIKGGVVMMAISKDIRRATQDLDIDFIRYSLDDSAIETFIEKLNDKDKYYYQYSTRILHLSCTFQQIFHFFYTFYLLLPFLLLILNKIDINLI